MKEIIVSEKEIKEICARIGAEISKKYENNEKPPVLIGVLKGATPFMMDLLKEITCLVEIDFVQYSSYNNMDSTGIVLLKKDITTNIKDRDVIVVEDILDTGRTMVELTKYLKSLRPRNIEICVLLDKPERREIPCSVDYCGKVIDDYFVIGYGLDYNEYFRNTKDVYKITPDDELLKIIDEKAKL